MNYKIITGANDSYILTLISFIEHYHSLGLNTENLTIYNLGLNNENLQKINNITNHRITIKCLDYSIYPEHVNLNIYNSLYCSYAFKPIILYNESVSNSNIPVLWLDCACRINNDVLLNILNSIQKYGFYCPVGNYKNTIESIELNHPKTIELLGLTSYEHHNELETRLACVCGVNYNTIAGKIIMDDWYYYSLDKNIIMPEGSSRNNHRQDQTVLSILMYKYEKKYNIVFEKSAFNISCWNKKDNFDHDKYFKRYKLMDKKNGQQLAIIYADNLEEAIKIYHERKQISKEDFLMYFNVAII
jgi:hypothetical protein